MKLDEIIETLIKVRDNNPLTDTGYLADLMLELAHHVKAQEPEALTEEDIIDFAKTEELAEQNKELGAAIRKVAHGLKE